MNSEMRKMINELTQDVINIFQIGIPIHNMKYVVECLGGEVREDEAIGIYSDGYIEKHLEGGRARFSIYVPSNQSENRKNFTIAHELGHLFLHMGYMIDDERWRSEGNAIFNRKGNSEIELQANEFAAALLMPKREYKEILDRYTTGDMASTSSIAEYFHVSVDAAAYRGKWLGYLEW